MFKRFNLIVVLLFMSVTASAQDGGIYGEVTDAQKKMILRETLGGLALFGTSDHQVIAKYGKGYENWNGRHYTDTSHSATLIVSCTNVGPIHIILKKGLELPLLSNQDGKMPLKHFKSLPKGMVIKKSLAKLGTGKGIRLGDTMAKVKKLYGSPSGYAQYNGVYRLNYEFPNPPESHISPPGLGFGFRKGKVVEINFTHPQMP